MFICMIMLHSHFKVVEILGTKYFNPKGSALSTLEDGTLKTELAESVCCFVA